MRERPAPRRSTFVLRAASAFSLLVLGAVGAVLAVASQWAQGSLTDTDAYVARVAPLAADEAVQQASADAITAQVLGYVDEVVARRDQGQNAAVERLAALARNQATARVHAIAMRVVGSEAFAHVWQAANRTAHRELAGFLVDDETALLGLADDGALHLQLTGAVTATIDALNVNLPFDESRVRVSVAPVVIADDSQLALLHRAHRAAATSATWLPWLSLALVLGGLALARTRWRAAAGVLAGTAVLAGLCAWAASAAPGTVASAAGASVVAEAFATALLAPLVQGLAVLAGAAMVLTGLVLLVRAMRRPGWRPLSSGRRPGQARLAQPAARIRAFFASNSASVRMPASRSSPDCLSWDRRASMSRAGAGAGAAAAG